MAPNSDQGIVHRFIMNYSSSLTTKPVKDGGRYRVVAEDGTKREKEAWAQQHEVCIGAFAAAGCPSLTAHPSDPELAVMADGRQFRPFDNVLALARSS